MCVGGFLSRSDCHYGVSTELQDFSNYSEYNAQRTRGRGLETRAMLEQTLIIPLPIKLRLFFFSLFSRDHRLKRFQVQRPIKWNV